MRSPLLLISLGVAALLLGCQSAPRSGPISELPQDNPTTTTTCLITGCPDSGG